MNKKIFFRFFLLCMVSFGFITANSQNQQQEVSPKTIDSLIKAIDKDPDNIALHEAYLKASGFTKWGAKEDPAFVNQYKRWIKKYPKSAVLPYALGHAYAGKESPKARPYLLKALKMNPMMDKAYYDLWIDAERWGEFDKGSEYIGKASEIKPDNPDYAFYYASSLRNLDPGRYEQMNLDVAKRFPDSERGAQALYWLAARSNDFNVKVKYYEILKEKYSPDKFRWSSSGMYGYFDVLLVSFPDKAEKLAAEMADISKQDRDKTTWQNNQKVSRDILLAKYLLSYNRVAEAIGVLDSIKLSRYSGSGTDLLLLKAEAYKKDNHPQKSYETLLAAYSKDPSSKVGDKLYEYGSLMKKSKKQVDDEVWYIRDTAARQATDFSLNKYFSKGKASLKDYAGQVVLLTYWFPGCGPCRGEFPHFQNVVNKFKDQDLTYLGINIVQDQNEYVIPFMKSSGYTFIPLEDYEGRDKGNLNNGNAAPVNFLIDKKGRVIFRNFRTDGNNEDVLENMISSLLKQG